ncbi:ParB/RepB/Spo0J family partition protein [Cereibacter sp. SYSU M97828]|nr:ParB/RepB/Spo0J family partition protein [Cereibacter flavus]
MNAQVSTAAIAAAAAVTEYVPLADLYLSPMNPRQEADAEGIALLAESLVACGLVQNLGGLRDEAGKVAIVFGGRRLRALNIAVEQRPDLAMVPVKIAPDALTAQAWANAENTAREDLNVADEIRAYGAMAANGSSAATIARAFGVTEPHVYRRLALSNLDDAILDALQAKEITLATAACFTVSNDPDLALTVLDRVKRSDYSEYHIKQMLRPEAITSKDRRVAFVTLEAYEANGGKLTGDLFAEVKYIEDGAKLIQMYDAKLEAAAEALRAEGWKWVEVYDDSYVSYNMTEKMMRLYMEQGHLTEAEAEEYDTLAEAAEAEAMDEAQTARFEELTEKLEDRHYSPEQIEQSGGWVYVGHNGALESKMGYVRKEDQAEAAEAGVIAAPRASAEDRPAEKSPFSQKLVEDMQSVELAAVQTALLSKPTLILDFLAFALSPEAGAYHNMMEVRTGKPRIVPSQEDGLELDERLMQSATTRSIDLAGSFNAFREKGQKHRNAALTEAVARTLNYRCGGYDAGPMFDLLANEAGASMRSIWTPTAANFFGRVSGAFLDALLQDLLGLEENDTAFRGFKSQKKAAKAAEMENLFSDAETQAQWNVTPEQKAKIDAWTPDLG